LGAGLFRSTIGDKTIANGYLFNFFLPRIIPPRAVQKSFYPWAAAAKPRVPCQQSFSFNGFAEFANSREINEVNFAGTDVRSLFSRNLRRLRALHNISQMSLADQADLTHNFINDIEKGKKWVSAETIAKIANALRIEPYQLFLPDSAAGEGNDNFFSVYLDDFSDHLQKMVGELKTRYLQDLDNND
jgi:transcriptional regulator with XRE-family HTH domain